MRVIRLEVSVYNAYIKNQFHTTFAQERGGGVKCVSIEVTVNSKEKTEDFCPNYVQEFGLW